MSRHQSGRLTSRQIDTTGMTPAELGEELRAVWENFCRENMCSVTVPATMAEVWDGPILKTTRRVQHAYGRTERELK